MLSSCIVSISATPSIFLTEDQMRLTSTDQAIISRWLFCGWYPISIDERHTHTGSSTCCLSRQFSLFQYITSSRRLTTIPAIHKCPWVPGMSLPTSPLVWNWLPSTASSSAYFGDVAPCTVCRAHGWVGWSAVAAVHMRLSSTWST